ncbi:receptor-type tyrosine-protein phosphatase T-like [Diadema antillarum]|uniref:receptor-type tyrosine-protein phosphatase T-like n=1 Tax=Diadema antillarum TaxID=105358 RepID=UPI003A881874
MELRSRMLALRCAIIIAMNMAVCGNILDMTCVNFNPPFDPNQPASFAAIVSGADTTSTLTFQRSIDLTTGSDVTSWCSYDDDVSSCQLPSGSNIESYLTSSAKVTLPVDSNGNNFGAYSCRAERYNWTTSTTTLLMRSDAHFNPNKLTVSASIDEEVQLVMNAGTETGTGSLVWMLNGQTDLSASVSSDELYISRASESMAGIHHYYYMDNPERGGIIRLIVRGCLDNLWGPNCQYTCPTCYNGGICDDISGRCVCPPGFMGDHCETACQYGFLGKNCAVSCGHIDSSNNDCQGLLFCLPDPYGCSCAAGWSGLNCMTGCDAGTYGADCTQTCHCSASSNQCDRVTGSCDGQGGCDTGWYGPQCQVHIVDMATYNHYAGVTNTANNFIAPYMIEDLSHPSIKFYIGREVDTGPGETGNGVTEGARDWEDSGLPDDTNVKRKTFSAADSLRATFNHQTGGAARAGAFETAVNYKDRTEKVVMINEYRGDSNADVWAEKLSYTVGVGETISLGVQIRNGLNQGNLVWRRNGDYIITTWRGLKSVTLHDVRKSDEGIYECYTDSSRDNGKHAIMRLFVRDCPSKKYGLECSNDCPDCYAGGLCHHVTGECVCRPGFQGSNCETGCGNNAWGKGCTTVCSSSGSCRYRLLSVPDPVGISCQAGFGGNKCETVCSNVTFGANCELDCNCASGVTCDSAEGCQGACETGYSGDLCQVKSEPQEIAAKVILEPCVTIPVTVIPAGPVVGLAASALAMTPAPMVGLDRTVSKDGYDYGTGPVHSYLITYSWRDDVGNTGSSDEPVVVSEDSTANITDLRAFSDYEFVLSVRREVEGSPTGGISSSPITAMTPCGTPTIPRDVGILSDSVNQTSATITWQEPELINGILMKYTIQVNPGEPVEITDNLQEGMSYQLVDLNPDTSYSFTVTAVSNGGESEPGDGEVTTLPIPIPGAPSQPEAFNISQTYIVVTWTAPSEPDLGIYEISAYELELSPADEDPIIIQISDGIQYEMTYNITDVVESTEYTIKVAAVNEGGRGPWSDSTTETTMAKSKSTNKGLAAGLGVGIPVLLIVLVSGILFYRKRRSPPIPLPKAGMTNPIPVNDNSYSMGTYESVVESPPEEPAKPPVKVTPAIYRPILLSNLAKYVKKKRLSAEGLEKEFKDLYNEIPEECVAFLPQNKKKNRYKNIVTFDEHRVKLKTESNQPGADYINATFFDGYRKKKAYIATQGPNTASLNDFWQMIYEQNVGAIVMLTNLVEDGKVKCLQYWPEADSSERYGDMFVTNKEEEKHAGFVHRRLELRFGDDEESRWVSQYHYTIWPDKREPECSQPLIDLRNIVRNAHPSDAGPLVVHCSAGVGRTGTFVTIDAMMSMIEQEKKVDIFNFVNNMRKRRSFMVQVEAQYEFIYETLLQWSVCPVMTCQLLDIAVVRPQWQKTDPASGKSEIAKQFELLDYITSDGTKLSSPAGLRSENMKKNRFADRMPADKSRPYLMMEGDYPGANQYINASFFDFEGKTNAHISTQCPLPSTITDFLRLVWDYDCRTVVHLNEMDKTCGQYWPSHGKDTYGSFTVELLKEHKDTDFMTKRVLNITSTKKKGAHRVDQFYYHGWPEDQPVPKSKGNFCQFILNVDEKNNTERPLLIVCIDGVGMSGTFLAAMATINKVKQDKTVDIFSAVKRLRKNRPGVVDSLERYEFCFDVVEAYKDSVQTYANFM